MREELEFSLAPELLDEGTPEERAAFGLFTVRSRHGSLTGGFDFFVNAYRPGPLVSGYHAAEWFAWNWWRLRSEPRAPTPDWAFAHRMTSIGEGYVWPNLTIFSDGLRTALISSASSRPDAKPFRYIGSPALIVPSSDFEAALDAFLPRIIGRLRDQGVPETNLDRLWRDLLAERSDPEVAKRRRLEALLGRDPEGADDDTVERLVAEASRLGEQSVEEVAAEAARGAEILTWDRLRELASRRGRHTSPRDAARLTVRPDTTRSADTAAWRVGADAARALREQERLGVEPVTASRLAEMAGTLESTVTEPGLGDSPISFVLDSDPREGSVVLRSRWVTGRRFDLARLIGDRLMASDGALHPATRAYTYRQKAQRAFAAELLAPFEAVDDMLADDYSMERQQDVAEHFDVSPMTVDTLLKNHGRIEREGSDFEFEAVAA